MSKSNFSCSDVTVTVRATVIFTVHLTWSLSLSLYMLLSLSRYISLGRCHCHCTCYCHFHGTSHLVTVTVTVLATVVFTVHLTWSLSLYMLLPDFHGTSHLVAVTVTVHVTVTFTVHLTWSLSLAVTVTVTVTVLATVVFTVHLTWSLSQYVLLSFSRHILLGHCHCTSYCHFQSTSHLVTLIVAVTATFHCNLSPSLIRIFGENFYCYIPRYWLVGQRQENGLYDILFCHISRKEQFDFFLFLNKAVQGTASVVKCSSQALLSVLPEKVQKYLQQGMVQDGCERKEAAMYASTQLSQELGDRLTEYELVELLIDRGTLVPHADGTLALRLA